jgi:hypothetical protein
MSLYAYQCDFYMVLIWIFLKRVLDERKLLGIIDAFSLVCMGKELLAGTGRKRENTILIRIFCLFLTNFHFMQTIRLCWIFIHFLKRSIERFSKPLSQQLNNTLKTISTSPFNEFIFSSNPHTNGVKTA